MPNAITPVQTVIHFKLTVHRVFLLIFFWETHVRRLADLTIGEKHRTILVNLVILHVSSDMDLLIASVARAIMDTIYSPYPMNLAVTIRVQMDGHRKILTIRVSHVIQHD